MPFKFDIYVVFENMNAALKNVKFQITETRGIDLYDVFHELSSPDGNVYFYLKERRESQTPDAPYWHLESVPKGLNLSGLRTTTMNGEQTCVFYGNPPYTETYKHKGKDRPNPLYRCRNDGYIFVADNLFRPQKIEMYIVRDGKDKVQMFAQTIARGRIWKQVENERLRLEPLRKYVRQG